MMSEQPLIQVQASTVFNKNIRNLALKGGQRRLKARQCKECDDLW
jgi:hypothetical protein